jgi:hypothetical protein
MKKPKKIRPSWYDSCNNRSFQERTKSFFCFVSFVAIETDRVVIRFVGSISFVLSSQVSLSGKRGYNEG